MQHLQSVFGKYPSSYFNAMIWAACCSAYFGLLRVSEFTTPSPDYTNPSRDLMLSDVSLDSHTSPQKVRHTMKQSKTDQFKQGTYVYLGKTDHRVCPVMALVQYLAKRGGKPGPLFMLPNNKSLTRKTFCAALNKAFQELEMNPRTYNTHSFRIGAATSVKQAGISDSLLKTLGKWKSNTYQKIRKAISSRPCQLIQDPHHWNTLKCQKKSLNCSLWMHITIPAYFMCACVYIAIRMFNADLMCI